MNTRAHLLVRGKVQGVFFRANMKRKAEELGVSGWVRNVPDGSVEAVVEGEEKKVRQLADWASKGPSGAEVREIIVTWDKPRGEFQGFSIRY